MFSGQRLGTGVLLTGVVGVAVLAPAGRDGDPPQDAMMTNMRLVDASRCTVTAYAGDCDDASAEKYAMNYGVAVTAHGSVPRRGGGASYSCRRIIPSRTRSLSASPPADHRAA
jgi:hypothetical protein